MAGTNFFIEEDKEAAKGLVRELSEAEIQSRSDDGDERARRFMLRKALATVSDLAQLKAALLDYLR